MKFLVICAVFGMALAAPQVPQQRSKYADIYSVRSDVDNKEDGTWTYNYENSDGSRAEQQGFVKQNLGNPDPEQQQIQVIQGSYSYYSPEGSPVSITYTADENGFQAQGDAIPTSPPIPPAIQKALEIIYRNAASQTQSANQRNVNNPPRRF